MHRKEGEFELIFLHLFIATAPVSVIQCDNYDLNSKSENLQMLEIMKTVLFTVRDDVKRYLLFVVPLTQ